jgi:hypothetical protein
VNIGQVVVPDLEFKCELLMIDAQQLNYLGIQIVNMNMNWNLKDIVAEVIGLADGSPNLCFDLILKHALRTCDPARQESQRSLAHGQDDWYDECLVSGARSFESEDTMGRACSSTLNRRMRTRTYGGVWRVPGNGHPYPISSTACGLSVFSIVGADSAETHDRRNPT